MSGCPGFNQTVAAPYPARLPTMPSRDLRPSHLPRVSTRSRFVGIPLRDAAHYSRPVSASRRRAADALRSSTGALSTAATGRMSTDLPWFDDLSAEDRWHIYISFNACANAPRFGPSSRPDWVVSRNTRPLPVEEDGAILQAISHVRERSLGR